jgi:hypothetical protein
MKNTFTKVAVLAMAVNCLSPLANAQSAQSSTYRNTERATNLHKTNDVGAGAKWGTLSGVNVKYWADEEKAIDATVAFADSNTAVGLDYLYHFRGAVSEYGKFNGAESFVPFVGAGLLSSFGSNSSNTKIMSHDGDDRFNLAARVPLGIEFMPAAVRLGVFAELGLGLGFVPTSYTFATGDIGARYYF